MDTDTPPCLRVTISIKDSNVPLKPLMHLGLATAKFVEKQGARAKCFKLPDRVIVEMTGFPRTEILRVMESLGHSMTDATLNVLVEERAAPEINLETKQVVLGEFVSERLTKKFLMGLPDGAIIVGNTFYEDGTPAFMVRLREGQDRSKIWSMAVEVKAAQCVCSIYWDAEDVVEIHGVDPDNEPDDQDEEDLNPFSR